MPRIHRILLLLAAIALFPGCGQIAQHQRRVPPAPSPAQADRLAVESALGRLMLTTRRLEVRPC